MFNNEMRTQKELFEYVSHYGKRYVPALRPEDLPLMPLHHCFDNCAELAAKHRKYKYVEGFAFDPLAQQYVAHAWLTDGVHAFDVTWVTYKNGEEVVLPMIDYIGIEMDIEKVLRFMVDTQYQSVLINNWRAPKLAEEILTR